MSRERINGLRKSLLELAKLVEEINSQAEWIYAEENPPMPVEASWLIISSMDLLREIHKLCRGKSIEDGRKDVFWLLMRKHD